MCVRASYAPYFIIMRFVESGFLLNLWQIHEAYKEEKLVI